MNEQNDQGVAPNARKAWQTPELREQTIQSTAQGKGGSPTQEGSPASGKPS